MELPLRIMVELSFYWHRSPDENCDFRRLCYGVMSTLHIQWNGDVSLACSAREKFIWADLLYNESWIILGLSSVTGVVWERDGGRAGHPSEDAGRQRARGRIAREPGALAQAWAALVHAEVPSQTLVFFWYFSQLSYMWCMQKSRLKR